MITRRIGVCIGLALLGGGCNHLAYVYNANGGLELSAAPTEGNVRLSIGGDRETYAVVPKTDPGKESDAMAVFAVSKVRLAGLRDLEFGHAIATGKPAVLIGSNPPDFGAIVDKIFKDDGGKMTGNAGGAAGSGGGVVPTPIPGGGGQ